MMKILQPRAPRDRIFASGLYYPYDTQSEWQRHACLRFWIIRSTHRNVLIQMNGSLHRIDKDPTRCIMRLVKFVLPSVAWKRESSSLRKPAYAGAGGPCCREGFRMPVQAACGCVWLSLRNSCGVAVKWRRNILLRCEESQNPHSAAIMAMDFSVFSIR